MVVSKSIALNGLIKAQNKRRPARKSTRKKITYTFSYTSREDVTLSFTQRALVCSV